MQAKKQELAWNITRPLHEELPRMSHRLTAFAVNYKIMWLFFYKRICSCLTALTFFL